jgi:hypothetical protein
MHDLVLKREGDERAKRKKKQTFLVVGMFGIFRALGEYFEWLHILLLDVPNISKKKITPWT